MSDTVVCEACAFRYGAEHIEPDTSPTDGCALCEMAREHNRANELARLLAEAECWVPSREELRERIRAVLGGAR